MSSNADINTTSVIESFGGATLPPDVQDQLANSIPNFPIAISTAQFNESWYSVPVTVRSEGTLCAAGYICNKTHQASCSDIQEVAISTFKLGNIHGGAYCPEGSPYYLNCPIGYYCPDPATQIICPAGMFCPYKTQTPEIVCQRCPAGATELWRDEYGVILFGVFLLLLVVYLVTIFFRRRLEMLRHKLESMSERILTNFDMERRSNEHMARLSRIKPKLDILKQRLSTRHALPTVGEGSEGSIEEDTEGLVVSDSINSAIRKSTAIQYTDQGQVSFDAAKLFDSIDTNGDGVLSYSELNVILQLDPLELNEFVRRMNALGSGIDTNQDRVTKAVFVQYFLDVLDETSNFRLTHEEAGSQWDEMFDMSGATSRAEVRFSDFYKSHMNQFLTDVQIKDVILALRKAKQSDPSANTYTATSARGHAFFQGGSDSDGIAREPFCQYYPGALEQLLVDQSKNKDTYRKNGIDITFQNLKLVVKVGRNDFVNVVDDVSGRIQKGTMTALLGGSGAGKTSLLNALCGRAYYGEVQGNVFINGQKASVEDFADSIGFVPQDDIVFAELTVRENLMYSGRFRLPRGTPLQEIEDLADTVLANLGLSRKANSIVGDVTRRGVSGGEKKRVNIGLELMAKPTALFLDEPTSGLDASSALLVMMSLKQMVEIQGVTICSVIHQPRKFIFDLFDSLLLLGVGGRMVYHGPVDASLSYFTSLGYKLPPGESLADWLIDISSGRIAVEDIPGETGVSDELGDEEKANCFSRQPSRGLSLRNTALSKRFTKTSEQANVSGSSISQDTTMMIQEPLRRDVHVVTKAGPSGAKADRAENEAKVRRELLYENWKAHFNNMNEETKRLYEPPASYDFPKKTIMPSFWLQFLLQMKRAFLLAWRNRVTKAIETAIIVFAIAIITLSQGTTTLTTESIPLVPFEAFIAGQDEIIVAFFQPLFEFALLGATGYLRYGVSVAVIGSVLIALTAVKSITEKRLEFFREAGSGYNSNAYFLAVNVFTTIDQGCQILVAAIVAEWLRHPVSTRINFYVAFLLLGWVSVSWSLFIPLVVPPKNTLVLIGFFMAFFGLMFGGTTPPVTYEDIYESQAVALFSAFFSPPRFFTETLAVSDLKCLPSQTGFSVDADATSFPADKNSFYFVSLGQDDPYVTDQSWDGWYWNALPAFMVGLTVRFAAFGAINALNQSEQAKKPFMYRLIHKGSPGLYVKVVLFWLCLVGLIGVTCWLVLL